MKKNNIFFKGYILIILLKQNIIKVSIIYHLYKIICLLNNSIHNNFYNVYNYNIQHNHNNQYMYYMILNLILLNYNLEQKHLTN